MHFKHNGLHLLHAKSSGTYKKYPSIHIQVNGIGGSGGAGCVRGNIVLNKLISQAVH